MKKIGAIGAFFLLFVVTAIASLKNPYHLFIAPATLTENSVTLLWDKQYRSDSVVYEILLNNKSYGVTTKTNFTINSLSPNTAYKVTLRIKNEKSGSQYLYVLPFKTLPKGKIYNILDYGAKDDTAFKNT